MLRWIYGKYARVLNYWMWNIKLRCVNMFKNLAWALEWQKSEPFAISNDESQQKSTISTGFSPDASPWPRPSHRFSMPQLWYYFSLCSSEVGLYACYYLHAHKQYYTYSRSTAAYLGSIPVLFSRRTQGAQRQPSITRIQVLFFYCYILPSFGNTDALKCFTADPSNGRQKK